MSYFGNYIQWFLLCCQYLVIGYSLFIKGHSAYRSSAIIGLNKLIIISTLVAILIDFTFHNTNSFANVFVDVNRFSSFILQFALISLLLHFFNSPLAIKLRSYFIAYSAAHILLVFVAIAFLGIGFSFLPGNLFRASTVNLALSTLITVFLITQEGRGTFRWILILVGYISVIFSLAKWNFLAMLLIPILYYYTKHYPYTPRIMRQVSFALALIFGLLFFTSLPDFVVKKAGYTDVDEFLNKRVFAADDDEIRSSLASGSVRQGRVIKDGGRFEIWGTLFNELNHSPFLGLGLGKRYATKHGNLVEDHNVLVFLFVRFGYVFGLLLLCLFIGFYVEVWRFFGDAGGIGYITCFTLFAIYGLYVMVGNFWGQTIVSIIFSFSLVYGQYNLNERIFLLAKERDD